MAVFDEAQVTSIASMFETNSDVMDTHLDLHAGIITDADKTEITAQIARFTNGTVKGRVWFEGKESNRGYNMSAPVSADNRDPRAVVAGLIQWSWYGSGQAMLVRG